MDSDYVKKMRLLESLDTAIQDYLAYYGEEAVHDDAYEMLTQLEITIQEEA